ncbi:MAG TPA: glycosyltransferase family 39 protein [Longimicrobiales bacterium]
MKRTYVAAAGLLGLIALVLPVQQTASLLLGATSPLRPAAGQGIWLFKLMLLVHAGVVLALGRFQKAPAGEPLVGLTLRDGEAWTRVTTGAVAALVLVGAWLRLHDLGTGLWFDEIQTLISYVRRPLPEIIAVYDSQNQHMLYSVLARVMFVTFGESAWALRLPSVLFGLGSLVALYWFASMIVSRREALLATALLTFSYHHVWFSQNARGYTGLLFWTLLGSGLFLKLLAERQRGWLTAAGYGLVMALAVYTHVLAVLAVAAHALIWGVLLARRGWREKNLSVWAPLVALVLAGTMSLQLYALVLPQFLHTLLEPTMEGVATQWKDPLWMLTETVRGLARGLPGGLLAVTAAVAVCLTGVVSLARRSLATAMMMILPGLLTAALLLSMEHNLWPRFFFFSAGFAVLIAVRGVLAIGQSVRPVRGSAVAVLALSIVLLFSAATVPAAWHPKQDYVSARDYVERAKAPGDAVVTIDMSRYAYQRYVAPHFLGVESEAELDSIERSHQRIWLLYTFPTRLAAVQPAIWSRVQREYKTAAEFPGTVNGGAIVVKVRQ